MLSTDTVSLNPNPLVQALGKPAKEFTKADIIGYIEDNGIQMLNLRYVGGDGRLKTLNFAIQSKAHLDRVLTLGPVCRAARGYRVPQPLLAHPDPRYLVRLLRC